MSARRFGVVASYVGLVLICLVALVVWAAWPAPRTRRGSVSITFAGLSHDASGATLAQFKVANAFSRRVRFGAGLVQIRQPGGWPNWMQVTNNWSAVAAGGTQVFAVPVPTLEGAIWRVPIIYQEATSMAEDLRQLVKHTAYAIATWRWGHPTYRFVGGQASSFIDGPEMVGTSNSLVQQAAAGRPDPDPNRIFRVLTWKTNRPPSAAGSRR